MSVEKFQSYLTAALLAIFALSTVEASRNRAFFELTQRLPLMSYECYRSGELIEPPSAVNVANLLDGTQRNNLNSLGTFWYEIRGQPDSYVTGTYIVEYNFTTGFIEFLSPTLTAYAEIILPPFNGAAYYFQILIPAEPVPRVVYKVFDTSGTCINAATLVFKTCYDVQDECCNGQESCQGRGLSLSRRRLQFGCSLLQYTRYPKAEPFPVCADYHSCT